MDFEGEFGEEGMGMSGHVERKAAQDRWRRAILTGGASARSRGQVALKRTERDDSAQRSRQRCERRILSSNPGMCKERKRLTRNLVKACEVGLPSPT